MNPRRNGPRWAATVARQRKWIYAFPLRLTMKVRISLGLKMKVRIFLIGPIEFSSMHHGRMFRWLA